MKKTLLKGPVVQEAPEIGLVLTDAALRPIACDKGAAAILTGRRDTNIKSELPPSLPKEILDAIGNRKAKDLSASKITLRIGNNDYNCRTYMMVPEDGFPAMVVLHIDKVCSLTNVVHGVAAKCNLTEREQQVLEGIAKGLSSKELAARMKISPNTIKVFIRLIMIKMGVTTRGGIVAQILQSQAQQGDPEVRARAASVGR